MKFRWYDALIILVIIALTACLAAFIYIRPNTKGETKYMIVERDNEEIYRLNLSLVLDEVTINIQGDKTEMVIGADHDGCWVISSGCPDKVCINTGKIIDSNDKPIICLPNKVSISIVYE